MSTIYFVLVVLLSTTELSITNLNPADLSPHLRSKLDWISYQIYIHEKCVYFPRSREARVRSLAVRTGIMWLMAVIFWTNDKFLCESVWHSFPYLHSGWHILIFLASYTACVLFAYFQVAHERPELSPKLRYVILLSVSVG